MDGVIVKTRPYDFGTDAIERQRVSLGQSLLDADFEYGLQSTKWQTMGDTRNVPSFYDIPGTDILVSSITHTNGVITVNATGSTGIFPGVGTIVFINGLQDVGGQLHDRAQGFFRVASSTPNTVFTYNSRGPLTTNGARIDTSAVIVRRGGYYGGVSNIAGTVRLNTPSIVSPSIGPTTTITCTTLTNHGLLPGTQVNVTSGTLIAQPGTIAVIRTTPSLNQFTFQAATTAAATDALANVYVHSAPYIIHRSFDGGVLITPQNPAFGASVVRQTKKVFRYQSGKGLLWSSGTLFCPNNDISSLSSTGTSVGSTITVVTSVPNGNPQPGAIVILRGILTSGYDGTYTITSIVNHTTFTVTATQVLGSASPMLGDQPRYVIRNWHGACVRAGCYDDQNGVFWEFDGQTLWVVKRSSTFQLAGTITVPTGSNLITGANTRFAEQLRVNDKVTFRGMTYVVTSIASNTSMSVNPPHRGPTISTVGAIMCKIKEQRTPQSLFNRDKLDGSGPSGFRVDLTKMQMIGIQYTWYGAGFVDFMMRGQDGNWVYAHRFMQNNMNDEAYMRTGNLPIRYELTNEVPHASTTLLTSIGTGDTTLNTTDDLEYWPNNATVWCNNEFITYSGKTSNTLTGCTRGATLTYNILDTNTPLTANSSALVTNSGNTLFLCSTTCSPSLTHWGSALLVDGGFDQDRGYLFNYSNTSPAGGVSFAAGSTNNIFLLRLAPTVSNGVVGDLGIRDLLNRAQLLLQRLDLWCTAATIGTGSAIITGILNPVFVNQFNPAAAAQYQTISIPALGGQPSFAQVFTTFSTIGTYVAGSGERIFSTICNAGSQYSIDLTDLKEISNNVIGGSNFFPDGPDTLLVQMTIPPGTPTITQYALNLFWSEAQA